jgi:hypothetical protein
MTDLLTVLDKVLDKSNHLTSSQQKDILNSFEVVTANLTWMASNLELKLTEMLYDEDIFEISEQINGLYFHPKNGFLFLINNNLITSFRKSGKELIAQDYRGGGYNVTSDIELRMVIQTQLVEV